MQKTDPTQSNQSAEKLLVLIEAMSALSEPIRLQDLSAKVGMNASTLLRFLVPLQAHGYAVQDPETSRYQLTFKLCGLAHNIASRTDLRNIAFPVLRNVAHIFKESANLSVDRDMSVMYIEVVNFPGRSLMMTQRIGNVAPMHCTGVGKIFLTEYEPMKLEHFLKVKGLPQFTSRTITDAARLNATLADIRANGYAFDDEECEEGARCVAAPIRDYTGKIIAGISVSGPAARMTDDYMYSNLGHLQDAARQISFRMGWKATV